MEESNAIWIEKYRPRLLKDIIGQHEIIDRLRSYVAKREMPHLLFTGNAGTGKTTAAVALAREFFGDEWQMNFRELNASDERGIDVVRNQIKQFARTSPFGSSTFKILFLDEADALTNDAQSALRRTMETYAQTCRFILSCNYSAKIIDPIQSRCAIYRFRPLGRQAIAEMVKRISEDQDLSVTDEVTDAIFYIAQGDMRKAINALQGAAILGREITPDMIFAITATARPEEIDDLIDLSLAGNFLGAGSSLQALLHDRGIAPQELIGQLYRAVVRRDMPEGIKVRLIDSLGETDFRLSEGAGSDIQMQSLMAKFVMYGGRDNL
ncbi:MAG: replication factor C small subunit [Methanomicrobiales archaeon]|jgi:replication factor C small subunit|nr:replication factor C small subunit [Methanomicrobiales archaeon]